MNYNTYTNIVFIVSIVNYTQLQILVCNIQIILLIDDKIYLVFFTIYIIIKKNNLY